MNFGSGMDWWALLFFVVGFLFCRQVLLRLESIESILAKQFEETWELRKQLRERIIGGNTAPH